MSPRPGQKREKTKPIPNSSQRAWGASHRTRSRTQLTASTIARCAHSRVLDAAGIQSDVLAQSEGARRRYEFALTKENHDTFARQRSIDYAARMSQWRKSSRTPSQFSIHTTNDCAAGVCECFERRHRRPAARGRQFAGPQPQAREELRPVSFRSKGTTGSRKIPYKLNAANRSASVTRRHDASVDH
jgi:hypothetical protein